MGAQPDELHAWMASHDTPIALKTITQKLVLTNEATVRKIPRTNINTTFSLKSVPQGAGLSRQLDADRVWTVDTEHNLMVTKPKETADYLLRLVNI